MSYSVAEMFLTLGRALSPRLLIFQAVSQYFHHWVRSPPCHQVRPIYRHRSGRRIWYRQKVGGMLVTGTKLTNPNTASGGTFTVVGRGPQISRVTGQVSTIIGRSLCICKGKGTVSTVAECDLHIHRGWG